MTNPFEIPADLRSVAEHSVEQAKKAFTDMLGVAQKATSAWEEQSEVARSGARDLGQRVMNFASENVMSSLSHAQRLVQAKDMQELMQVQSEFIQAQLRSFGEQAKALGQMAAKASTMKKE